MKKILFTIICSIILFNSYSQKAPVKYGTVDLADLEMKAYPTDSSAPAAILCDYGYFNTQQFQFYRTLRIKI